MAQLPADRIPVAQDVFTYCTREKIETWHVVRNHNAQGTVDRVVCKSCKSEHNFIRSKTSSLNTARSTSSGPARTIIRSSSGTSSSGGSRAAAAAASAAATAANQEESWFSGIKKWGDKAPKAYAPTTHFLIGDVVEHSVFGKGVVHVRRENKVEVLFKSGPKTLPSATK
jgi:hypothetical protein